MNYSGDKFLKMTYIKVIKSLLSCFLAYQMVFFPAVSFAQFDPAALVPLSKAYNPIIIKGLQIFPDNPLRFDFIVANGDKPLSDDLYKKESENLIKYFMASLAVPEKDMWVNLSPYEKNRIIPQTFNQTQMGIDLLAQDYLLKQITASVMYPDGEVGKQFWARVNAQAKEKFNISEVPIETFNKVWIVPDVAEIYVHNNVAYIVNSRLKVMLEKDYLALKNSRLEKPADAVKRDDNEMSQMATRAVKEIVIPVLDKEVNEGKHFTLLRQIYNSMLLATWYKHNVKNSMVNDIFSDHNKPGAAKTQNPGDKDAIYQKYVGTFQKGVYNYIKEEYDAKTDEMVPRKYFSGGVALEKANIVAGSSTTLREKLRNVAARNGAKSVSALLGQRLTRRQVVALGGATAAASMTPQGAEAFSLFDSPEEVAKKALEESKNKVEWIFGKMIEINKPGQEFMPVYNSQSAKISPKIVIQVKQNEATPSTYTFVMPSPDGLFELKWETDSVGRIKEIIIPVGYELFAAGLLQTLAENEESGVGSDIGKHLQILVREKLKQIARQEFAEAIKGGILKGHTSKDDPFFTQPAEDKLLARTSNIKLTELWLHINENPGSNEGPVEVRISRNWVPIPGKKTPTSENFDKLVVIQVNIDGTIKSIEGIPKEYMYYRDQVSKALDAIISSSSYMGSNDVYGIVVALRKLHQAYHSRNIIWGSKASSSNTDEGQRGESNLGGIDLDPAKTKMSVTGQEIYMNTPEYPGPFENMLKDDVVPNILQIQNIPNIPMLLGLEENGPSDNASDPKTITPAELPASTPAGEQMPSGSPA